MRRHRRESAVARVASSEGRWDRIRSSVSSRRALRGVSSKAPQQQQHHQLFGEIADQAVSKAPQQQHQQLFREIPDRTGHARYCRGPVQSPPPPPPPALVAPPPSPPRPLAIEPSRPAPLTVVAPVSMATPVLQP
ncbi:hypothetical protein ZWY2020_005354 [Hordeum vulgare]|nr:hypothetical protein ZWY2020_005354 [Hordeum vulgare]